MLWRVGIKSAVISSSSLVVVVVFVAAETSKLLLLSVKTVFIFSSVVGDEVVGLVGSGRRRFTSFLLCRRSLSWFICCSRLLDGDSVDGVGVSL